MEGFEFILPKMLSSPKIVYSICLVNEGNFSITHTMMFVIFKVIVKWRLFDDIPFYEIHMGWLVIFESRSKFPVLPVYCFEHALHEKKIRNTVSVIKQNGKSQNGGTKKAKHAKSSEKRTFLTTWYAHVSGGKKCLFFGKFDVLCFLVTSVLRFALLSY